jgi:hypothetical protein
MRYWRQNPLRARNPWWRRNPPFKDHQDNPLTELQVKQILKLLREVQKGWHTREWFLDLLKMGEDTQVVRYILSEVEWGALSGRGKVPAHILKSIESYLESLDKDRFPEVSLDMPLIQSLLDTRSQFPLFVEEKVHQLEMALFNLELAERLDESRESINRLKNRVISLQKEINDIIVSIDEEKEASIPTTEVPPMEEEILACTHCGGEDFVWLESDERSDVVDISHNSLIAELQHRLRHIVMELRAAMQAHRPKTYIFDIEDDMEEVHAKIERLRASNLYRRYLRNRKNPYHSLY